MSAAGRCSICEDAIKSKWVNEHARNSVPLATMERMSRAAESPVRPMKRETIKKHLSHTEIRLPLHPTASQVAEHQQREQTRAKDVATLVQQKVIEKIENDDARITVQHGLQAQAMLDRRVERAKDRELSITLARMLHAEQPPPSAIEERPVVTIEGEVRDVG